MFGSAPSSHCWAVTIQYAKPNDPTLSYFDDFFEFGVLQRWQVYWYRVFVRPKEPEIAGIQVTMEGDITSIVSRLNDGDPKAPQELLPLVYEELHALANAYFVRERRDHTLQPTSLVHEAYVRLLDQTRVEWQGKAHFLAVAATAMKRVLIDHARKHNAIRRGGQLNCVTLSDLDIQTTNPTIDLIALDELLEELRKLDERQYRIVELRFFGGLTMEQVATVMSLSKTTIESEWRMARAWLSSKMSAGDA